MHASAWLFLFCFVKTGCCHFARLVSNWAQAVLPRWPPSVGITGLSQPVIAPSPFFNLLLTVLKVDKMNIQGAWAFIHTILVLGGMRVAAQILRSEWLGGNPMGLPCQPRIPKKMLFSQAHPPGNVSMNTYVKCMSGNHTRYWVSKIVSSLRVAGRHNNYNIEGQVP